MKSSLKNIKLYHEIAHELKGAENIKKYCMAGNAIVTMSSPTGIHKTYYIRAPYLDDKSEFTNDVRFVYALVGDNTWLYVGGLYKNGSYFRLTRNSRFNETSPIAKGAYYLTRMMNEDFDTPMILQHEGCCARCGKRLTDPQSIERGFGPHCWSSLTGEK